MNIERVITAEGKKILHAIEHLNNKSVRVGWFAKSHYEDGARVATVAAENEFGRPSKNIPARPFLRPTIIREESAWIKLIDDGSKKVLHDQLTIDGLLTLLGIKASSDIQKSIELVQTPALAESTIKRRQARYKNKAKVGNLTKPLIDTGVMIATVTHELSDE